MSQCSFTPIFSYILTNWQQNAICHLLCSTFLLCCKKYKFQLIWEHDGNNANGDRLENKDWTMTAINHQSAVIRYIANIVDATECCIWFLTFGYWILSLSTTMNDHNRTQQPQDMTKSNKILWSQWSVGGSGTMLSSINKDHGASCDDAHVYNFCMSDQPKRSVAKNNNNHNTWFCWQWPGPSFWKFQDTFKDVEPARIWPSNVLGHFLKKVTIAKVIWGHMSCVLRVRENILKL